jgi:hypothetical protein
MEGTGIIFPRALQSIEALAWGCFEAVSENMPSKV